MALQQYFKAQLTQPLVQAEITKHAFKLHRLIRDFDTTKTVKPEYSVPQPLSPSESVNRDSQSHRTSIYRHPRHTSPTAVNKQWRYIGGSLCVVSSNRGKRSR